MLARLIRLRDAPNYLGMDKNRFNKEVRPYLTEIPIGEQGIAFDRIDLDEWVDHYKQRNGRPAVQQREVIWEKRKCRDFEKLATFGTSTNTSTAVDFAKALALVDSMKQKNT